MADEEVDWGMDDSVDVWRQGDAGVQVGEDDEDDVISLEGGEAEEESRPVQRTSSQNKVTPTGPSKTFPTGPKQSAPPNGPRRVSAQAPNSSKVSNGQGRESPKKSTVSITPDQPATSTIPDQPKPEDDPLPEGWTRVMSLSQGKYFYHNPSTKETRWTRPAPIVRVATPPPEDSSPKKPVEEAKPLPLSNPEVKEREKGKEGEKPATKPAPAGNPAPPPADPVASAYAKRNQNGGPPSGPRGVQQDDRDREHDRRRPRSRSPMRREDDRKRPRTDDRRSPPSNGASDRRARSPPRSHAGPPQGPRSYDNPPPRSNQIRDQRDQRNDPRPQDRRDPVSRPRSPVRQESRSSIPPAQVKGANTAPLATNRWGSKSASNSASGTPVEMHPAEKAEVNNPLAQRLTSNPKQPPATVDEAAEKRAKLREEAKKAEEALQRIKDEEAKLERELAEKKLSAQKPIEQKDVKDEPRKPEQHAVRESKPFKDMTPARLEENGAKLNFVPRGRDERAAYNNNRNVPRTDLPRSAPLSAPIDRRPISPPRRSGGDSYRPGSPPPSNGGRDDGYRRDDRGRRDDRDREGAERLRRINSPNRLAKRSPPPMTFSDRNRPPPNRPLSPPRRGGDSYYPDSAGPPPVSLLNRMGANRRPVNDAFAEPMSVQATQKWGQSGGRSPVNQGGPNRGYQDRERPRVDRPFAERMRGENEQGRRL